MSRILSMLIKLTMFRISHSFCHDSPTMRGLLYFLPQHTNLAFGGLLSPPCVVSR
ncbi:hypothetical protein Enr13x_37770 [Stieleria neptunia]|uniref:Uncharacterized protein n=1 Tax=Stieleria neptunia TaxID=2527979 RepID=A0A518HSV1_9BACT|nr:hypothetical protein Enr13x_37770 [Stieleria neptunia]